MPLSEGCAGAYLPQTKSGFPRLQATGKPYDRKEVFSMVHENRMESPELAVGIVIQTLLFLFAWFLLQEFGVI